MRVLSLFSGIGAFEKALDNLEIPYELVAYCEIDKYASKSYAAIHSVSEDMNLGDITTVDAKKLPKDIDLLTYGFPCQDISLAGKQKGLFNEDGSQTRSGLFFEALRIIEETQPKVAIAENVKNLTSKKFNAQFQIVLESLEQAGYNNYWQVLNATDYGVPQNRERVFIVSIRKDVDSGEFKFPNAIPLGLRLKDLLESNVDEKYYLSEKAIEGRKNTTFNQYKLESRLVNDKDVHPTILARYEGAPTLLADDKVIVKEATKKGYAEAFEGDSVNLEQPNSKTRRGRVGHGVAQTLTTSPQQAGVETTSPFINEKYEQFIDKHGYVPEYFNPYNTAEIKDVAPTQTANCGSASSSATVLKAEVVPNMIIDDTQGFDGTRHYYDYSPSLRANRSGLKTVESNLRIRKLTPKECFRLMGFSDADFEKAEAVNSNTQLYKQAGNSIVVPVLEHLIKAIADSGVWKEQDINENNSVRQNTPSP